MFLRPARPGLVVLNQRFGCAGASRSRTPRADASVTPSPRSDTSTPSTMIASSPRTRRERRSMRCSSTSRTCCPPARRSSSTRCTTPTRRGQTSCGDTPSASVRVPPPQCHTVRCPSQPVGPHPTPGTPLCWHLEAAAAAPVSAAPISAAHTGQAAGIPDGDAPPGCRPVAQHPRL